MNKIKVSAVSYLNTLPFVHGLNQSGFIHKLALSLDAPSECARRLMAGEADVGLVPVAVIPQLKYAEIISEYCIGADGKIDSVSVMSQVPLDKIKTILLDYESRTSALLIRILAEQQWKIEPEILYALEGFEKNISGNTAGLVIGNRALLLKNKFRFEYDLAAEWKKMTGLPFVFACWVCNGKLSGDFIKEFNNALRYGISRIENLFDASLEPEIPRSAQRNYLKNSVSYILDKQKEKGMKKFLELAGAFKSGSVISTEKNIIS